MNTLNYKFNKPYLPQQELEVSFSVSNSTLKRFMAEWLEQGGDLSERGHMSIKGIKQTCWNPDLFLDWIIKHKCSKPAVYDYEKLEQNKILNGVKNLTLIEKETINV